MNLRIVWALALSSICAAAAAQVGVGVNGAPSYSVPITVPPGISGMTPQLSVLYAGGGVNGPQGHGWSVQGISTITRCPSTPEIDGTSSSVNYVPADRLCLDGQRLVRTDASGVPTAATSDDASGIADNRIVEFRTEKDSFVRVRAYGYRGNSTNNGPKWFRVWTKAGQVFDYGDPATNPGGAIVVEKPGAADGDRPVMTWAIARQSDTLGNYIDFVYSRRSFSWGSGSAVGVPTAGAEWNIAEIRYTGFSGTPTRAPNNKIVFDYTDRTPTFSDRPFDPAEAYQAGFKNVSVSLLRRIRSFVGTNLPAPVLVRTVIPTYENSPVTGRSRITQIKECFGESTTTAGEPGAKCTQPAKFTYADSGGPVLSMNTAFNLTNIQLMTADGSYGVLSGDFNGDGLMDLLRWSALDGTKNVLYNSNGNGSFTQDTRLNLPDRLFTTDGCYYSSIVDMNADGLPDILRFAGKTKLDGSACAISANGISHVFINKGAGVFAPRAIQIKSLAGVVSNATLERKTSTQTSKEYCGRQIPRIATPDQTLAAPIDCRDNPRTGYGWTSGATFYFIDVNGDGRPDLITTTLASKAPQDPLVYGDDDRPSCPLGTVCTRVYIDDGTGLLVEKVSNVNGVSLYSHPGVANDYQYSQHIGNVDGDAFADLVSVGKADSSGNWRSSGDGNFTMMDGAGNCDRPIDFNGDGRADCLYPSATNVANNMLYVSNGARTAVVAGFNLKTVGYELLPADTVPVGQRFGHFVIDLNGDDRGDILRWHDDASKNKVLLSNGDGTFRDATSAGYTMTRFMSSDGKYASVQGDFLGQGTPQLLRLAADAPTGGINYGLTNNLYARISPMVPDRLVSVTSPTGLVSTLSYATVANAPAGRYVSDRGTSQAAAYPSVDVAFPMPIVVSVESDTGVGATKTRTEYAYLGLKADAKGQGLLGFRESRTQSPAADGSAMTVATQHLQRRPYAGVAQRTESRLTSLAGYDTAATLSRTINIYCDKTSAAAPTSATEAAPCATTAKVTRPYLYKSTETGFDIDAARTALPTVTTTNELDDQGNVTKITQTTTGYFDNNLRTYTKVTDNTYISDTSGDYWVLGRLTKSSVRSTVPNLGLVPSAGTAPYAGVTDGAGVTQAGDAPPQSKAVQLKRPPKAPSEAKPVESQQAK